MKRGLALVGALALAACHRGAVADVTLDADEAARNATAAKTLADLAAADVASRAPMPPRREAIRPPGEVAPPEAPPENAEDAIGNGADQP